MHEWTYIREEDDEEMRDTRILHREAFEEVKKWARKTCDVSGTHRTKKKKREEIKRGKRDVDDKRLLVFSRRDDFAGLSIQSSSLLSSR